MTKAEAGRLGGLTTFLHCGPEGMSQRGKLGGRPLALTLEDIRQQQLLAQENEKGVMDTPGNNLKELKKLCRLRCRSSSPNHKQIGRGCATTTTPAGG